MSISTARKFQPSLGIFLDIWLDSAVRALQMGGTQSLLEVYCDAHDQYANKAKSMDVPLMTEVLARLQNQFPSAYDLHRNHGMRAFQLQDVHLQPVHDHDHKQHRSQMGKEFWCSEMASSVLVKSADMLSEACMKDDEGSADTLPSPLSSSFHALSVDGSSTGIFSCAETHTPSSLEYQPLLLSRNTHEYLCDRSTAPQTHLSFAPQWQPHSLVYDLPEDPENPGAGHPVFSFGDSAVLHVPFAYFFNCVQERSREMGCTGDKEAVKAAGEDVIRSLQ